MDPRRPFARLLRSAVLSSLLFGARTFAQSSPSSTAPASTAIADPPTAPRVELAPGRGVTIETPDGAYRFGIRGRLQLRDTVVGSSAGGSASAAPPCDLGRVCNSAEIRRARLVFFGHTFSPHVQFYVMLGFGTGDFERINLVGSSTTVTSDFASPLLDAYVSVTHLRDLQLRAGQFLVPWDHARWIGEGPNQFVERSSVTTELSLDRDVGVSLYSDDFLGTHRVLSYQLGVFSGKGRNRLAAPGTAFGLMYVARAQVSPLGAFDDMAEGDQLRLARLRIAFSGGAAYNQSTDRQRGNTGSAYTLGGFDYFHAFGDVVVKWRGLSLLGEALYRMGLEPWRNGATPSAPREFSRSAAGWIVQAGAMLTNQLEIAARWGGFVPIGPTGTNQHDPTLTAQNELGGVVSWYFRGHDLKLQTDYFYLYGDQFSAGHHQLRLQLALTL